MRKITIRSMILSSVAFALVLCAAQPARAAVSEGSETIYLFTTDFNLYLCNATFLQTPSGKVSGHCEAELFFGTPVSEATHSSFTLTTSFGLVTVDVVETPSGDANISFHN